MKLSGIVAATVVPFTEDGKPDLDIYAAYIDELSTTGVGGLAINCDSGEAMSLWPQERRAVMRTARDAVDGRVPLVAGVISAFTEHAEEVADEAAQDGADLLLAFPNVHLRGTPLDPQVPLRYLQAIHDTSGLPIVAFQLQDALGGVEYERDTLASILEQPFVTAIKESTFDAHKFRTTSDLVRSVAPDVAFLSGNDNFIYESFVLGADGALIGAGSIATALQVDMFRAVNEKRWDDAAALNARLEPLMKAIFAPPIRDYRARTKEGLVALGTFPNARVREPLLPVPEAERKEILTALSHAGLL